MTAISKFGGNCRYLSFTDKLTGVAAVAAFFFWRRTRQTWIVAEEWTPSAKSGGWRGGGELWPPRSLKLQRAHGGRCERTTAGGGAAHGGTCAWSRRLLGRRAERRTVAGDGAAHSGPCAWSRRTAAGDGAAHSGGGPSDGE
jgi:hypothetical protein